MSVLLTALLVVASSNLSEDERPNTTQAFAACGQHIHRLEVHQDRVWLSDFRQGLCHTEDGETFVPVADAPPMINALASTPRGLYVGTTDGLFLLKSDGAWEKADTRGAIVDLEWRQGALWGSQPGRLLRWGLEEGPLFTQWWSPGDSGALQALSLDEGRVWLASEDQGVVRLQEENGLAEDGGSWRGRVDRRVDALHGAPGSWALDVMGDGASGAWVASLNRGLWHVGADGGFQRIEGVPEWGLRLLEDGGQGLWFGSQSGLHHIQPVFDTHGELQSAAVELVELGSEAPVHALLQRSASATTPEQLWVGTEAGLHIVVLTPPPQSHHEEKSD